METHAPDGATFAHALGLSLTPTQATDLRARVLAKLSREPVEDLRIDFEDGYGVRPDDEEDGHADAVGVALREAQRSQARCRPSSASASRRWPGARRDGRCGRWSGWARAWDRSRSPAWP